MLIKPVMILGAACFSASGLYLVYYAAFPKTIKEKIIGEGLVSLDLSFGEKEKEEWEKKVQEYREEEDKPNPQVYSDLSMKESSGNNRDYIRELKTKCIFLQNIPWPSKEAYVELPMVRRWCFRKPVDSE